MLGLFCAHSPQRSSIRHSPKSPQALASVPLFEEALDIYRF